MQFRRLLARWSIRSLLAAVVVGVSLAVSSLADDAKILPQSEPRPLVGAALASVEPSPNLTPADVVSAQMAALTAKASHEARIAECYRLASPANREHTGPLEQFAKIFESPDYVAMLDARYFLVGRPIVEGREAHVLVTVISPAGVLTIYRFFLTQQPPGPHADCWMTDAVLRMATVTAPPPRAGKPNRSI